MRLSVLLDWLPLLAAAAIPNEPRGFLQLPVKTQESETNKRQLTPRQIQLGIEQKDIQSFINLTIGTPPQPQSLLFDLGSWSTWVNPDCSELQNGREFCQNLPRFQANNSATIEDIGFPPQEIHYGSGRVVAATKSDKIGLGGVKVDKQLFAIATESTNMMAGIFGAGIDLSYRYFGEPRYMPVFERLKSQGFIKRTLFGLDLRGPGDDGGSLTIGGIDLKKFTGSLEKRPIVRARRPSTRLSYTIRLDDIAPPGDRGNGSLTAAPSQQKPLEVTLDSGSSFNVLPSAVVQEIMKAFPSAEPSVLSFPEHNFTTYKVDCALQNRTDTIDLTFGGLTLKSSYRDLVYAPREGEQHCTSAFASNSLLEARGNNILGAPTLRSAYMVADWQELTVYLGQSSDCGSEPLPIDQETTIESIADTFICEVLRR
ncbi:hypothetical protein HIM_06654 [Hirsutella minnesotensis 3608]|uniref:Peptidase A1 domain-containing protein n=1 Tax=Hirsutella minnesotensis 3608 TaxID=1043627 RepID=A0A0F7ZIT2_9HYPO|nr:hypothetical protein HIM_06654 [Hirsutella minnesotensis 3608]